MHLITCIYYLDCLWESDTFIKFAISAVYYTGLWATEFLVPCTLCEGLISLAALTFYPSQITFLLVHQPFPCFYSCFHDLCWYLPHTAARLSGSTGLPQDMANTCWSSVMEFLLKAPLTTHLCHSNFRLSSEKINGSSLFLGRVLYYQFPSNSYGMLTM